MPLFFDAGKSSFASDSAVRRGRLSSRAGRPASLLKLRTRAHARSGADSPPTPNPIHDTAQQEHSRSDQSASLCQGGPGRLGPWCRCRVIAESNEALLRYSESPRLCRLGRGRRRRCARCAGSWSSIGQSHRLGAGLLRAPALRNRGRTGLRAGRPRTTRTKWSRWNRCAYRGSDTAGAPRRYCRGAAARGRRWLWRGALRVPPGPGSALICKVLGAGMEWDVSANFDRCARGCLTSAV